MNNNHTKSLNKLDKLDPVARNIAIQVFNKITKPEHYNTFGCTCMYPDKKLRPRSMHKIFKTICESKNPIKRCDIIGKSMYVPSGFYDFKLGDWRTNVTHRKIDANRGLGSVTFGRLRDANLITYVKNQGYVPTEIGKLFYEHVLPALLEA